MDTNIGIIKHKDSMLYRVWRTINDDYSILYVVLGLFLILTIATKDTFLTMTEPVKKSL